MKNAIRSTEPGVKSSQIKWLQSLWGLLPGRGVAGLSVRAAGRGGAAWKRKGGGVPALAQRRWRTGPAFGFWGSGCSRAPKPHCLPSSPPPPAGPAVRVPDLPQTGLVGLAWGLIFFPSQKQHLPTLGQSASGYSREEGPTTQCSWPSLQNWSHFGIHGLHQESRFTNLISLVSRDQEEPRCKTI